MVAKAEARSQRKKVPDTFSLRNSSSDFIQLCSPLLDEKAVYVQAGTGLAKLDKKTGKLLWRTLEENDGMMSSAFSSPTFATLRGKLKTLCNLLDGVKVWTVRIKTGNTGEIVNESDK